MLSIGLSLRIPVVSSYLPDVDVAALCAVLAGCVTGTRAVILVTDFGAANEKNVVSFSLQQFPETPVVLLS